MHDYMHGDTDSWLVSLLNTKKTFLFAVTNVKQCSKVLTCHVVVLHDLPSPPMFSVLVLISVVLV